MTLEECPKHGGQCKWHEESFFERPAPSGNQPIVPPHHTGPEQVHLIGGAPDWVTVAFASEDVVASEVWVRGTEYEYAIGTSTVYANMMQPSGHDNYEQFPQPGNEWGVCGPAAYQNQTCYYTSPYLHYVTLPDLSPSTKYEYSVGPKGPWRAFKTPPAVGQPITFGVLADVGHTNESVAVMRRLQGAVAAGEVDGLIFPGDLAYGDGFSPAWDSWGRLSEFLLATVPTAYGIGNHEVSAGMENYANFLPRYGWPKYADTGSVSPMWFSYEAGLAHVIMLCAYCTFASGSPQYAWLAADLARVDRQTTPWLFVTFHVGWYVSNVHHDMSEGAEMRRAMEDLLFRYEVDLVMTGHLHGYERALASYKGEPNCKGPVHITIGDGGNHEGPACPWQAQKPAWSAYREFSFGHARLAVHNRTSATWEWHRNQDDAAVIADRVDLVQQSARKCGAEVVV